MNTWKKKKNVRYAVLNLRKRSQRNILYTGTHDTCNKYLNDKLCRCNGAYAQTSCERGAGNYLYLCVYTVLCGNFFFFFSFLSFILRKQQYWPVMDELKKRDKIKRKSKNIDIDCAYWWWKTILRSRYVDNTRVN